MNIFSKFPLKCIIFVPFFISVLCHGQTARIYDSSSNLPNAQINTIYQDRGGFIWIGTQDGLTRFDGTEFTSYRHDSSDNQSIASNLVLAVFDDSRGTKWIGTSVGLQIYDSNLNAFKSPDFLDLDTYVSYITEYCSKTTGTDRVFIGTSGKGVVVLDPDTHQTDSCMMKRISKSLYSDYINYLFVDSKGRLWISSEIGGLSVVSANSGKATADIKWDEGLIEKRSSTTAYSMAEDPVTHNIIICTANDGILVFEAESQTIRRVESETAAGIKGVAVLYNNLFQDQYGPSFLIGVENEGIKIFDTRTESLRDAILPNTPFDYSTWKVHCLTKDNQGNLWVGAFQTGILVVPRQIYGFSTMKLSTRSFTGENSGCITAVLKDERTGDIWVGADGGGVFNLFDNEVYTSVNSCLSNNSIMALAMDRRGTLWIGTYLDGIFCKSADGTIKKFKENSSLPTEKIASMVYDEKRDRIYIGTHGSGLLIISAENQKVLRHISHKNLLWTGSLNIDKDEDMLWIGAQDGLARYDLALNELHIIEQEKDYMRGIILSTCIDGDILWIGTRNGLVAYNTTDGSTEQFTEKDGLPSNSIMSIQKDETGRLWLGTTNGLVCMDTEALRFSRYYAYDGLQGNEFRQMASYKSEDGLLYFGGNDGLTRVNPMNTLQKASIPPVHITKLSLMTEPVDYNPEKGRRNYLDKPLPQVSSVCLPHSKNFFNISFSVLEYTNPLKIHYRFTMEHFDRDWVETDQLQRNATYTNLSPGKYIFRIRAFYEDDPGNFSEKEIRVRIMAPWYASPWALIIYCLLLGTVYLYIRKARKNREKARLQAMRLNMFTDLTHEIRTPLTLVMSPLKTLRENETDTKLKETYSLMYRNSLRINRIVNQFMDIRKLDEGKMRMNFQETDIVYFIQDIIQSFKALEEQKNIALSFLPDKADQKLWIDQGNFDKIIFNVLSNAFKYTPEGGKIRIAIHAPEKNNGRLGGNISEITVIDIFNSGSHIISRDLDRVFERFYQTSAKDTAIGSGVGLNLTKMLVEMHHGSINARNVEDGVIFSICIPCGNKHLAKEDIVRGSLRNDLYEKDRHEVISDEVPAENSIKITKKKKTVVFVDDDKDLLSYVSNELISLFNVITFNNAHEALSMIRTLKPDAVVTDLVMPEMNGDELCRLLKNDPDTALTPVIILTAQTDDDSLQEATDNAADRVLTKPISIGLLSSSISQTVSAKERIVARQDNNIIYEYGSIKVNSASDKLVTKVIDCIKNNMDNSEFSVEALCEEVGISRVHLNRKLKELVGTSPSMLIRSIRLRQAAFLLINNEVGIAEVAYKVGYSSLSHFSNSFHEYFNMSPKEFVARYKGVTDEQILKQIFE